MWNPDQYARYRSHRARPFFELLAQVDLEQPRTIVDLGCGTGELTATLAERWPHARVVGIDASAEMLEKAARIEFHPRLSFQHGTIESWTPDAPVDLLVSNAALQWVPEHTTLIPRLAGFVADGGTFAMQVPGNFDAPSHTILRDLRLSERWRPMLGGAADRSAAVMSLDWYVRTLTDLGFSVNAWETTYLQILHGDNPVLEWVKGTALRPVLAALDEQDRGEFLDEYGQLLAEAYPVSAFGTVFPFRRLFVVAESGRRDRRA